MFRQIALWMTISVSCAAAGQHLPKPRPLRAERLSATDLVITPFVAGDAVAKPRRVSRKFLLALPQVSAVLHEDESFPEIAAGGVRIGGIDLNVLAGALGISTDLAITVICRDGYIAPLPAAYRKAHQPVLVLTMDGMTPHAWAKKHHSYDPSPYFIDYADFVPASRVLSHEERPQQPTEVVNLRFLAADRLYAAITPVAAKADPPEVTQGLRIAEQNCFRCHNSGDTGGTKAKRSWHELAEVAKQRPDYFAKWVHDPRTLNPKARMPPNLTYDRATLDALTRYFQTFSSEGR